MTDNVHKLKLVEVGDNFAVEADVVLKSAMGMLDRVFVVGRDESGEIHCYASHGQAESLLLLEFGKQEVLGMCARCAPRSD